MSTKPVVALLLPIESRQKILAEATEEHLASIATVIAPAAERVTPEDMPILLSEADAALTGWGTPTFSRDDLTSAAKLSFIAHAAGSIHYLGLAEAMTSGRLRVSHAAGLIADAVAEFVVAQAFHHLRGPYRQDADLRAGIEWFEVRRRNLGQLLGAQTIGIVGAGYVGRIVIQLLLAFKAKVLVYDPFLTAKQAAALGGASRSLDDLFEESDIVSLHAPVLPETMRMIGAEQLAKLRDDALFINTARAALVDEAALLAALRQGRLKAALDVFDNEPLSFDNPFKVLPNASLSPHSAGHTIDTYRRQGQALVEEIERFFKGEPLKHEIEKKMLKIMA